MPTAAEEASVKNKIMKELNRHPFRPAWWLRNRHAQTIYVGLVRKQLGHIGAPKMRRERWDTPDGDFLDLDWHGTPSAYAPLVLLLHAYAPAYAIEPLGRAIQAGLPLGAIRLVLHAGAGRVAVIKAN